MNQDRFSFVDKASAVAMILVVYGHIIFPETLEMSWWKESRDFIYKFHMPLFMFLSGFIVFLSTSRKNLDTKEEYLKFEKKKFQKFFPAYFFFSLLGVAFDIYSGNSSMDSISKQIFSFFFTPDYGSAGFVWYLYVLMGFYLITPMLLRLQNSVLYLLLFLGFLLTNTDFSIHFSADLFAKYFFFFLSGGLMFLKFSEIMAFLNKRGVIIVLVTFLITIVDFYSAFAVPYQLVSLAMIFSIVYLSNFSWLSFSDRVFIELGKGSFAIYLLNTSIVNLYYLVFKKSAILPISGFFVFSALIFTLVVSIIIRNLFNKIVPAKVYSI